MVILKFLQTDTADSSQVEHTRDMMEFLEKLVFAYRNRASAFGNLGMVVVEKNQHKVVVDNQAECEVVHNLQSLVEQDLGKLEIDQTQVELVEQVQIRVGIVGIEVVEIEVATVVESTVVVVGTTVFDLTIVATQQ